MNDRNAKKFAGNVKMKLIVTSYCQARSGMRLQSHSDGQSQHPENMPIRNGKDWGSRLKKQLNYFQKPLCNRGSSCTSLDMDLRAGACI